MECVHAGRQKLLTWNILRVRIVNTAQEKRKKDMEMLQLTHSSESNPQVMGWE